MGIKSWFIKTAINYAKPYIKKEVSVSALSAYATKGIDWATSSATKGLTDKTLGRITKGCALGSSILGVVSQSIDPTSEGGRIITETEKQAIISHVQEAVHCVITQEMIDGIIDAACARVIERFEK